MEGKVKIRIDEEGDFHIDVEGIEGTKCEDITAALIKNLGEVEEQKYTEEYCQDLPDFVEQFSDE